MKQESEDVEVPQQQIRVNNEPSSLSFTELVIHGSNLSTDIDSKCSNIDNSTFVDINFSLHF